jgi:hypothetical protein
MGLTEIYALHVDSLYGTRKLVRRLDGDVAVINSVVFVPVECFATGERWSPRMDMLKLLTEMEVIAWASK